jgi:hypothetical protein
LVASRTIPILSFHHAKLGFACVLMFGHQFLKF